MHGYRNEVINNAARLRANIFPLGEFLVSTECNQASNSIKPCYFNNKKIIYETIYVQKKKTTKTKVLQHISF